MQHIISKIIRLIKQIGSVIISYTPNAYIKTNANRYMQNIYTDLLYTRTSTGCMIILNRALRRCLQCIEWKKTAKLVNTSEG